MFKILFISLSSRLHYYTLNGYVNYWLFEQIKVFNKGLASGIYYWVTVNSQLALKCINVYWSNSLFLDYYTILSKYIFICIGLLLIVLASMEQLHYEFFYVWFIFQANLLFLVFACLVCVLMYFSSFSGTTVVGLKWEEIVNVIRYSLLAVVSVSMCIHSVVMALYLNFLQNLFSCGILFEDLLIPDISSTDGFHPINAGITPYLGFSLTVDWFGLVLLLLAYIVGGLSLVILEVRLNGIKVRHLFIFNFFIIVVFLFTTVTNVIVFFLMYECLLLPSFLFVYWVSPSRRAIQASIYFVVWTQIGSFIVMCGVIFLVMSSGCYEFTTLRLYSFTQLEQVVLYSVFFLGFGVKVPIWPFHYWLTKTHVEAPSGFSIYLSGFLVKSALYGFYKLVNTFTTSININIFLIIVLVGVIDASLKMWVQTDLKKLVAYGTIQEMNLIFFLFCWGDTSAIGFGVLFCLAHALLSTLMFFVVDCVYRRFHTRSIVEINGILHLTPNLGIISLLMCIVFAGFPSTIKFVSEFYIFAGLIEFSTAAHLAIFFIANVCGAVGFCKNWFNVVFGCYTKKLTCTPFDLTKKELFFAIYTISLLVYSGLLSGFVF